MRDELVRGDCDRVEAYCISRCREMTKIRGIKFHEYVCEKCLGIQAKGVYVHMLFSPGVIATASSPSLYITMQKSHRSMCIRAMEYAGLMKTDAITCRFYNNPSDSSVSSSSPLTRLITSLGSVIA